ncbi:MAG: hypothetical protein HGA31_04530 [Candidatus Moranbacteria bacterium]|nr:hypothetical protein [Candidatus Moranbacteria bacterium]
MKREWAGTLLVDAIDETESQQIAALRTSFLAAKFDYESALKAQEGEPGSSDEELMNNLWAGFTFVSRELERLLSAKQDYYDVRTEYSRAFIAFSMDPTDKVTSEKLDKAFSACVEAIEGTSEAG